MNQPLKADEFTATQLVAQFETAREAKKSKSYLKTSLTAPKITGSKETIKCLPFRKTLTSLQLENGSLTEAWPRSKA